MVPAESRGPNQVSQLDLEKTELADRKASDEGSVAREDPYARRVRDSLWVIAATAAAVSGLLAFASFPVGGWRQALARGAFAATALAMAPVAVWWKRSPPDLARAHLAMGGLCLVVVGGVAVQFLTMQVPIYTVNLAVVLVGSGAVMLSRAWLVAIAAALIAVWCVVGLQHLETSAWDGYRMILPRVAILAFGIQEALRRSAHRSWQSRVEIEQRQREREATADKLREAQRLESIGEIAGGLAHDFNNLLVAIMGNAELAIHQLPADSPAREDLAEVLKAGEHAKSLTGQLLAFSGGARTERCVLSLDDEVAALAGLLAAALPKGIALTLERSSSLPPVEVDRGQLQQVLMNLVVNAGEADASGANAVTVRTGHRALGQDEASDLHPAQQRAAGDYAFVEVSDRGCGMDLETQARMFDPFFSRKRSGRGLGLSAVLGIARTHDGGVQVDSRPGEGSSLRVYFPASDLPFAARRADAVPTRLPEGVVVLVVDDEPGVRKVGERLLKLMGASVLQAADGTAAIELLVAAPDRISAVLLDMTMPGLSGEQTLERLLAIRPDLPVVLTSGYEEKAALARSLGKKNVTFLAKPFGRQALAQKLANVIAVGTP
jgi:signal transduction histidine kinase/CheY-like chemotaxis protein